MKLSYASWPHAVLPLLGLVFLGPQATAQIDVPWLGSNPGGGVFDGDFNVAAHWDHPSPNGPFVPEGEFDERAVIANGGTATASTNTVPTQGYLTVTNGTLEITSSGEVRVEAVETVDANGDPTGVFTTGAGSFTVAGALQIDSGGVFGAETLQLTGTFRPMITNAGFTPIDVGDSATVGGALQVEFSGFTPAPLDSWPLLEANSVSGGFASITATGITLTPSQQLTTRLVDQGGGRTSIDLLVDQLLTLEVNRETGAVKMFSDGVAVDIDSYTITSESGSLDDTGAVFDSLTDQVGSTWRESNISASQLAELQQTGATSVNGTGFGIGNVYSPPLPTEFRDPAAEGEDLVFTHSAPDGVIRSGLVEYVGDGPVNDLLLTVDPTDGRAQISNPSGFNVDIESYSITSPNGELIVANWDSLDDADGAGNDDGGWRESNPSNNFLAELNQDSVEPMTGSTKLELGDIYDFAAGSEDLVFEFLLAGESQGLIGTVLYREIPDTGSLPGDFNGDSRVDAADYTVWRDNLGGDSSALNGNGSGGATVTAADYQLWRSQFGQTAGSLSVAASAVPEPSTSVVLSLGLVALGVRYRRCSRAA